MDKPAVQDKGDCWICFNKGNNIILTTEDSERTLKSCETYLDISIIIKDFGKETAVSCCNSCYASAHQLISLEEQVEKLGKEISEVSSVFFKNVLERRSRLQNENNSILRTEKSFESPDYCGRHADDTMENVMVKKEIIEFTSKEFPADSQGNARGNDGDVSDPWFETYDNDNPNNEECETTFYSEAEIDVKYSYDEVSTRAFDSSGGEIETNQAVSETNAEEHQQTETTSMAVGKYLKMSNIHLKGFLCDTSRNSAKSEAVADEENIKCEMALDDSCESNNSSKTISRELRFKCHEISCSKSFKRKRNLVMHHRIHSEEKPYKCSSCSKSFKRSYDLKSHDRIHSGEKPYKCNFCEKLFSNSSNLRAHETIHSGKKPYKCCFCEDSFKTLNTLKKHEAIHSEKKPYKCSLCEKSYLRPIELKIHERIHTGERHFNCSFCSKSFSQSGNLKRHEMIHTGDRPHKCSFCSKSFMSSGDLKRHEMIHTGERPHKCTSCENTFIQNSKFKIHYDRMHGDEQHNE